MDVVALSTLRNRFVAWWEGYELDPQPEPDADETAAEEESANEDSQPSRFDLFRERFMAWWEGREYGEETSAEDEERLPLQSDSQAPVKPLELPPEKKARTVIWTPERIKIAERVWGAGFTSPGGEDYILKLVGPLALKPERSVLDLGAGLGGPARAMVGAFGVWVTAMEPSEVLAAQGMEESTRAGMAKKAAVVSYDPESVELRRKGFDCVFAKETFFTVVNKRRLFGTIAKSLKKDGQLLFTDYLLAKSDPMRPEIQNWITYEPVPPELWSIKQTRECLENLKFEIRVEEDISDEVSYLVLKAWRTVLSTLKPGHLRPELGEALVDEAEMWLHRAAVLASTEVRVYRVHAFKR